MDITKPPAPCASTSPRRHENVIDVPPNLIVGNLDLNTKNKMMFLLNCMDGDVAAVRGHLDTGTVDVNCRDSVNMTPLMRAAHGNHVEIAKLLLNARADPCAVDEMRPDRVVTALDYALGCGLPVEIVERDSKDENDEHRPKGPHEEMAALIGSATDLEGTELKDQTRQLITNEPQSMLIIPASRLFELMEEEKKEAAARERRKEETQYHDWFTFLTTAEREITKFKRIAREDRELFKRIAWHFRPKIYELESFHKSAKNILSDECIDLPAKIEAMSALEISFNTHNKRIDEELRAMKKELEWEQKAREGGTRNTRRRLSAEVNPAV